MLQVSDMIHAVRSCLNRIGYQEDLILPDYKFTDFLSKSTSDASVVRQIELAAFSQTPPSIRSACLGVTVPLDSSAESIRPFSSLGAPQLFALHPEDRLVRRWKINATGNPEPIETIEFDTLESTFDRHRSEWGPRRISDAKTLTFIDGPAQLDFFDFGLLPALEASLRVRLEHELNNVLVRCKDVYTESSSVQEFNADLIPLFRLVFRLVAAKMMIDRGSQTAWSQLDAGSVVAAVDAFYFSNEDAPPVLKDEPVQKIAWQIIREGLNLQNLTVETLAHLYENAFVTEEVRRQQSVHATPQAVAEYMLRQLPLPEIPIEERLVFEPFCGAAPFLVAALGRLRDLLPSTMSPVDRHAYFVRMLSGVENDEFSLEIARYSLILADYPNPNGWRLTCVDNAYTDSQLDDAIRAATIVLCNPPFGDFLADERDSTTALTKEAEALRRVLSIAPRVLGFVLPRSFLDRGDCRQLRLDLVAKYRNVSVMCLPDKVFQKASQEVVLIIADNVSHLKEPYSFATVRSNDYDKFLRTGAPTWLERSSTLIRRENDVVLARTPLQSIWDRLSTYETFGSQAEIHVGIHYKTGSLAECVMDAEGNDFVPGIANVDGYFEPYIVRDHQFMCLDPDRMRDNAYLRPWDRPKVIVNRARTSRDYWNIAGALDEQGLYVSRQFYGIWPTGTLPVEVLVSLINGPVANAYLFGYPSKRDNLITWMNRIPIPTFTDEHVEMIKLMVQDYYSVRGQWLSDDPQQMATSGAEARCLSLLYKIDALVLEAYNLPEKLEHDLLAQFDGIPRRPLPYNFPGYGAKYENAKDSLRADRDYNTIVKEYEVLVEKKYGLGLTPEEVAHMELVRRRIDDYNAPYYDPIIKALSARD